MSCLSYIRLLKQSLGFNKPSNMYFSGLKKHLIELQKISLNIRKTLNIITKLISDISKNYKISIKEYYSVSLLYNTQKNFE